MLSISLTSSSFAQAFCWFALHPHFNAQSTLSTVLWSLLLIILQAYLNFLYKTASHLSSLARSTRAANNFSHAWVKSHFKTIKTEGCNLLPSFRESCVRVGPFTIVYAADFCSADFKLIFSHLLFLRAKLHITVGRGTDCGWLWHFRGKCSCLKTSTKAPSWSKESDIFLLCVI